MKTHVSSRTPRFINLPGQTLAAISGNENLSGPPVVFVHGITASVDVWLPSLPEAVLNDRRWISLSLPGHHPARIDRQAFGEWKKVTPAAWAEWYDVALREIVGDEPVDVVGWSTGGFTALALAAHFPQRVRSVLSIAGFADGQWIGLIGRLQKLRLSFLTRWAVQMGFNSVGRRRAWFDFVTASGIADRQSFRDSLARVQTVDDWFAAFAQHDSSTISELFRKIAEFNLSSNIGQIQCPVLIAGGEADPYVPASHTRWMADQVRGAELVLWPGAGHMFFAERTREYQEMLLRWLNRP